MSLIWFKLAISTHIYESKTSYCSFQPISTFLTQELPRRGRCRTSPTHTIHNQPTIKGDFSTVCALKSLLIYVNDCLLCTLQVSTSDDTVQWNLNTSNSLMSVMFDTHNVLREKQNSTTATNTQKKSAKTDFLCGDVCIIV